MSRWRREGGWLFGAGVVQQVVGVLVLVWLAREVRVEAWGRFAVDAATLGLLASLGTAKLNVLAVRTDDASWTAGRGAALVGAMRAETLALVVLGVGLLAALGRLGWASGALVVGLAARHLAQQVRAASERRGRYGPLVRRETAAAVVGHGVAVVTVLAGDPDHALHLRELAWGATLLALVALDLADARLWPGGPWFAGAREHWDLARLARPAWVDGLAEQLFDRVVVLLAAAGAGEYGAGIFAQARGLASRPHQLLAPLAGRLGLAWLSRRPGPAERRAAALGTARRLLPLAALAALGVALLGPRLVPMLLGERWAPAGEALAWLAGFVGTVTLLELAKSALLVEGRLGTLVLVRAAQVAAFLGGAALALGAGLGEVAALASALSFATAVAATVAYALVARPTG